MYEKKGPNYGHELRVICKKHGYINFVDGVIKLYTEGKSLSEIGKFFGRSKGWAGHIMRAFDIPLRPQGGANFKGKKEKDNGRKI